MKVWKGALVGAGCGLLASAVMNVVPTIWSKIEPPKPMKGGKKADDATVRTAVRIADPVLSRDLKPHEKELGGAIVHFTFGTMVGALYGGLAQVVPPVTLGLGTAYATAVWLLGDEYAVPKLNLNPPDQEMKPADHLKYWLAHVAYGLTLDGSRRLVEKQLD